MHRIGGVFKNLGAEGALCSWRWKTSTVSEPSVFTTKSFWNVWKWYCFDASGMLWKFHEEWLDSFCVYIRYTQAKNYFVVWCNASNTYSDYTLAAQTDLHLTDFNIHSLLGRHIISIFRKSLIHWRYFPCNAITYNCYTTNQWQCVWMKTTFSKFSWTLWWTGEQL